MAQKSTGATYSINGFDTSVTMDHGYCPFCPYSSSAHQTLNNHVQMHLHLAMFCGRPGCFFVSLQAKEMIEHSSQVHHIYHAEGLIEKKRKRSPSDPDIWIVMLGFPLEKTGVSKIPALPEVYWIH